jgi:putative transcriptional regulator
MNKFEPKKGNFLIAEPFLLDNYFSRSVILLCEHDAEMGSVGFMINRLLSEKLDDFFPELSELVSIPIYFGGPVHSDRLHFIHSLGEIIPDGIEITKGIFWGGDFKKLKSLLLSNSIDLSKIKFFLGYSGWDKHQLGKELEEKAWIISEPEFELIFSDNENEIWKQTLKKLGGNYAQMINYPIHPSLN